MADLSMKVNITEIDKFKDIRNEYKQKLFGILEEKQSVREKMVNSFLSKSYL